MKKHAQNLLIAVLMIVSVGLLFFIASQTVFKNYKSQASETLYFDNEGELRRYFVAEIKNSFSQDIILNFENRKIEIDPESLEFNTTISRASDSPDAYLNGEPIKVENKLSADSFLNILPIKISSDDGAFIFQNSLVNCESGEYDFEIDEERLDSIISELLDSNSNDIEITLEDLVLDDSELSIINQCRVFLEQKSKLQEFFQAIDPKEQYDFFGSFKYTLDGFSGLWSIEKESALKSLLSSASEKYKKNKYEGQYVEKDGKILLTKEFESGQKLDVEQTFINLKAWTDNPSTSINASYIYDRPELYATEKEVLDFTKLLASGKSRLDIIRNGHTNVGLNFAFTGLFAVDGTVIEPGEEFSYIGTIRPTGDGFTEDGFGIGGGICNSTTTIFRAALEAGFEITERNQHYYNVPSYEWGYPLNIVDAAYYTSPKVDLKFINDIGYPVLMKFEYSRPGDNYQYHTVNFYTSSEAPNREVELFNWQKWAERSETVFQGSFDRKVTQDGNVLREDTFKVSYRPKQN
ncbi:MAG TPA: VanW family protein [Candidatus Dojkabacteria bacterium]|jgi:vancomycin resistance protein YoaR